MSNLDNILQKIKNDAEEESKKILEDAKKKRDSIIEEKKKEAEKEKNIILNNAKVEANSTYDKTITKNKISSRNNILMKKEEIIEEIIDKVKKSLKEISSEDYLKYLKNSLDKLPKDEKITLMVPKKYYEDVKNLNLDVNLSDKNVESGFKAIIRNIIYNGSFESILDSRIDELTKVISEKLFKD